MYSKQEVRHILTSNKLHSIDVYLQILDDLDLDWGKFKNADYVTQKAMRQAAFDYIDGLLEDDRKLELFTQNVNIRMLIKELGGRNVLSDLSYAINRLTPMDKHLITARYINKSTLDEIVEAIPGCESRKTAQRRCEKALKTLYHLLDDGDDAA